MLFENNGSDSIKDKIGEFHQTMLKILSDCDGLKETSTDSSKNFFMPILLSFSENKYEL